VSHPVRNRFIAAAMEARCRWLRLRRALRSLGHPHLRELDHVTIPVSDLARARRFYCDVLGATYYLTVDDETLRRFGRPPAPDGGEGAHHVSVYLGGRTRIDLFLQHAGQPGAVGHPHLGFRVPPREMGWWKVHLERLGVPSDGPIQLGFPGQASLYFNDPFGNHLEVVTTGLAEEAPVRFPRLAGLGWQETAPVGGTEPSVAR